MTQSHKIQKPKRKEKLSDKEQSERFEEAVRALDADRADNEFDNALSKIVAHKIRSH